MSILGFSKSAVNRDIDVKNMDEWGYNYLIEYKKLWEKEKLLKQFLLFPQCFQKLSVVDASK